MKSNIKEYRFLIEIGFSSENELDIFLAMIENDENISDTIYYNLRHAAIKEFYEN